MGNSLHALVTTSTLDDLEIVARIDWGKVHGRAPRLMAARLRTAALRATELQAPFGGWKLSGVGRELGPEGLMAFRESKHIKIRMRQG